MLPYNRVPIQEVKDPRLDLAGVRLLILREDLNNALVSGNKWWKLKNNLEVAKQTGNNTILTFGGAYSNHIFATAAAARSTGLKSIGVIRGEQPKKINETLSFAQNCGMELYYVSRETYRRKTQASFMEELNNRFGLFFLIPEGGSNEWAVKGCAEWANFIVQSVNDHFDYLCLAVGTGGTMAGLIKGFCGKKNIIGFSILKNGEFLNEEIKKFLPENYGNWQLQTGYSHGGYAKVPNVLKEFIKKMDERQRLPLDSVYTGKMLWGIFDLVNSGFFKRGVTILAIHTGGLQQRGFQR